MSDLFEKINRFEISVALGTFRLDGEKLYRAHRKHLMSMNRAYRNGQQMFGNGKKTLKNRPVIQPYLCKI